MDDPLMASDTELLERLGAGDDDRRGLLESLGPEEEEESASDDEFESESRLEVFDVEQHARMVTVILKPVGLTMALVVALVRIIHTMNISVK